MPTLQLPSRLFAAVYDRMSAAPEEAGGRETRHELLAPVSGATLEIGAGTGLNLDHYTAAVTRLELLEPDAAMAAKLRAKLDADGRPAEIRSGEAQALPYPGEEFDSVVATLVLCSVPDQAVALREIARVLRPGGRFFFMEHVRSENPRTARVQDLVRPLYVFAGRGCHPNRDTFAAIEASPLEVERCRRIIAPKVPATVNEVLVGTARRPPRPES